MKLLLDTHIWIWSQLEPERLSGKVKRALRSPRNEIWLSAISTWEFLLLVERQRISLEMDVARWLELVSQRAPTREAPLTHEIALATREIELAHRDPVDRFLAATARALGLILVTSDERLLSGRGYRVLANQ